MPMIAMMLARYWKPLAIAAIFAAAIGYRAILVHERDAARRDAAASAAAAAQLRADNQSLAQQIRSQNAAVEAIRKAADEQAQAMSARAQASMRAADSAEAAADADARSLAQSRIANGCDEAIRWGREQARELGKW